MKLVNILMDVLLRFSMTPTTTALIFHELFIILLYVDEYIDQYFHT